jgi:hypothetical protein
VRTELGKGTQSHHFSEGITYRPGGHTPPGANLIHPFLRFQQNILNCRPDPKDGWNGSETRSLVKKPSLSKGHSATILKRNSFLIKRLELRLRSAAVVELPGDPAYTNRRRLS